jgi:hypothetical protein
MGVAGPGQELNIVKFIRITMRRIRHTGNGSPAMAVRRAAGPLGRGHGRTLPGVLAPASRRGPERPLPKLDTAYGGLRRRIALGAIAEQRTIRRSLSGRETP